MPGGINDTKLASWPNAAAGLSRYNAVLPSQLSRLPVMVPNYAGSLAAVRFEPASAGLGLTGGTRGAAFSVPLDLSQSTVAGATAIFMVAAAVTTPGYLPPSAAPLLGSASSPFSLGFAGPNMDVLIDASGTIVSPGVPLPGPASDLRLYEYVVQTGGSQALLVNGVVTALGNGRVLPSDLQLGGSIDGYIAELIVFTQQVPTPQRQQIEAYLARRYGIPLPANHPYNANGYRSATDPGAAAPITAPSDVAGLAAWLRPDALPVSTVHRGARYIVIVNAYSSRLGPWRFGVTQCRCQH
jgi:hypothetical protein